MFKDFKNFFMLIILAFSATTFAATNANNAAKKITKTTTTVTTIVTTTDENGNTISSTSNNDGNAIVSAAPAAQASQATMPAMNDNNEVAPISGWQVLLKRNLSADSTASANTPYYGGVVSTQSSENTHIFGIGMGYANNNEQGLGFRGALTYDQYKYSYSSICAEGNATYTFNIHFIPFAGINMAKYVKGDGASDLNSDLGYQLGVAGNVKNRFGYIVNYQTLNFSDSSGYNSSYELREKSLQLGLTYTL